MADGVVNSRPRTWLRLDGGALLTSSIALFDVTLQQWWIYPTSFFVPDIFMIGYLRNSTVGVFVYNAGHSYFLPSLVVLAGWHHALTSACGLIWLGHVGFDRLMGYGLKYDSGFTSTHLGGLAQGAPQHE